MKTTKYYLISLVVAKILCISSLCIAATDQGDDFSLIAQPNPTLANIKELSVSVAHPPVEPNTYSLSFEELQTKLLNKLNEANIPAKPLASSPLPSLKINIAVLRLGDSQDYVFHIQTSLERQVILTTTADLHLLADVWKTEPVMRAASGNDLPAAITTAAAEQVDAFIAAHMATNPKASKTTKADNTKAATKAEKNIVKKSASQSKYVASKNGKIFHTADCASANRIKPENLITYNSREDAIKDGKRPCKQCNP